MNEKAFLLGSAEVGGRIDKKLGVVDEGVIQVVVDLLPLDLIAIINLCNKNSATHLDLPLFVPILVLQSPGDRLRILIVASR